MTDVRYGVYLRPSVALAAAVADIHQALERRWGLAAAGRFMLRNEVGDAAFLEILRGWTSSRSSGHGTTDEFIALAEQVSGQQLDDLFATWLFTPGKPEFSEPSSGGRAVRQSTRVAEPDAHWLDAVQQRLQRHGRY